MNLLDVVKRNVIGVSVDDIDEDDERYYEEERSYSDYRRPSYDQYSDRLGGNYGISERGKIVDLPSEMNDMRVAVKKPTKYDDAREVCDKLKEFSPVVVNLEKLDREEAQRVVDFIMGACYTMDGHVVEIKEDVFLVAPSMVNIDKEKEAEDSNSKSASFFSKFSF